MKIRSMAFLLLFAFAVGAQAQKQGAKPAPTTASPAYCDEAIKQVKANLLDDANKNCASVPTCIECIDRSSGTKVYVTLVVQPDNPTCKKLAKSIKTEEPAASRGADAVPVPVPNFKVDILQSGCFKSGVNLQTYLPGYGEGSRDFGYLWEIDGQKAGHLSSVQCACGKEAKVRVTQLATGLEVTKVITLHPCGSDD